MWGPGAILHHGQKIYVSPELHQITEEGAEAAGPVLPGRVPAALSRDAGVFAVGEKRQRTKAIPRQLAPRGR